MKQFDLTIIGGGMVGLALAALLKESDLHIAVIEAFPPITPESEITCRVSALNIASEKLLEKLGVWQALKNLRATPYNKMDVWEKDSFANIQMAPEAFGLTHLGHIAENHLIQKVLWDKVSQQENVEIITTLPKRLDRNADNAILTLENNELIVSKLIVGADGANSWTRQQVGIPVTYRDYGHHAFVCNVQTAEPHQNCARQIFSPESILAFLPLHEQNLSSIVWSQPQKEAERLVEMDAENFNKELTVAFDNRLGTCEVVGERKAIKLTARYARNFAQSRIALVGDAAHTIHPLAGLGVNLGFQDAVGLAQNIQENLKNQCDIGEYRYLRSFERQRKVEAVKMLASMQGLKSLFAGNHPVKKFIRGVGLSTTNKLSIVKNLLMKQGLGI